MILRLFAPWRPCVEFRISGLVCAWPLAPRELMETRPGLIRRNAPHCASGTSRASPKAAASLRRASRNARPHDPLPRQHGILQVERAAVELEAGNVGVGAHAREEI